MIRRPPLPRVRIGGRLLVLACLIFALLPPPLPWSRAALDLIVLVDDSLSMPRSFNDKAWQQLRELLADAPPGSRLRLIRFAANPALEARVEPSPATLGTGLPRGRALDRTATDIAAALQEALRLVMPDRPATVVLVSDTAATHGDTESALGALHRAGVPLYLLTPPDAETGSRPRLRQLQVPSRVNAGDRVTVVALVDSAADVAFELALEIDGRVEERRRHEPVPGEAAVLSFTFPARAAGVSLVTIRLLRNTASGRSDSMDAQTRAVNVLGPSPLLYVTQAPGANPTLGSLQRAGWEVSIRSPAELAAGLSQLRRVGTIILDNLATGDMGEAAWRALVNSVQVDGRGLLVLGGPHSFGAGAYRRSTLEGILPVTAEAAEPEEPAAALFLLDRSGSMGRQQAGPSRLSLAREAVASSAKMLLPEDYLGIITFATDAQTALPLATRQADRHSVLSALEVEPAGGTRLGPALRLAAEQLAAVEVSQRIVILVTDGFAGDEDLQATADDLQVAGITVIALAVGEEPKLETLQLLTAFNQGQVLPVADAATLPRLMSAAVATRRAPAVAEATVPAVVQAPPFPLDPALAWPPLSGYMVSKARPTAQVYLQSARGDPLFATGMAGAGRVAVLPAGLGSWAGAWWRWPNVGAFLGGLVHWLDPGYAADGLSMTTKDRPGQLQFTVDLRTGGKWDSDEQLRLLVDDPAGGRTELTPTLVAPGRYRAMLPATQPGLYQATLQAGGRTLRHAVYRNAGEELQAAAVVPSRRRYWLEQGWVKAWAGVDDLISAGPRDASGLRETLLALALFSYLLLLALERGLLRPAALWLRARF